MPFRYKCIEELESEIVKEGLPLHLSKDLDILKKPIKLGDKLISNRIAIQPMEGCDAEECGTPSELTERRYKRFAASGAGLIWFEAVAVMEEGKSNLRQLSLGKNNLEAFKRLVFTIRQTAEKECKSQPLLIMQATHSGRYSKPTGLPMPLIAYNNELFEKRNPISSDRIVSDDYLKILEDTMGQAAKTAQEIGFDGIDIKSCHRYLYSELLSAYTRPGVYGGSFENRTRCLRNSIENAQTNTSGRFIVTTRINAYDGFPYPYGFGVEEGNGITPSMGEIVRLSKTLHKDYNVKIMDISVGNPYVNSALNRPSDKIVDEQTGTPLKNLSCIMECTAAVQKANPDLVVVGTGMTYLRQFGANLAAGEISNGTFSIAGFGRQAFAYPNFAHDILYNASMNGSKCCITCSKCTEMMRHGTVAGCVIRDTEMYLKYYNKAVLEKEVI